LAEVRRGSTSAPFLDVVRHGFACRQAWTAVGALVLLTPVVPSNGGAAFPYKIHKVLTDNGVAFADLPKNPEGPTRRFLGPHIFDRVCLEHGIEHRLTKPYHPWTNGQAERMNRTVKEATVQIFHYEKHREPEGPRSQLCHRL